MNSTETVKETSGRTPNAEHRYEVTQADLPLHCPLDDMSIWNSHPRVFLAIEETGKASCPYCGAEYVLKN